MKSKSKSEARRLMHQLPPGSDEALDKGCLCPILDNSHGKGYMESGDYWINEDCPLHGIDEDE